MPSNTWWILSLSIVCPTQCWLSSFTLFTQGHYYVKMCSQVYKDRLGQKQYAASSTEIVRCLNLSIVSSFPYITDHTIKRLFIDNFVSSYESAFQASSTIFSLLCCSKRSIIASCNIILSIMSLVVSLSRVPTLHQLF